MPPKAKAKSNRVAQLQKRIAKTDDLDELIKLHKQLDSLVCVSDGAAPPGEAKKDDDAERRRMLKEYSEAQHQQFKEELGKLRKQRLAHMPDSISAAAQERREQARKRRVQRALEEKKRAEEGADGESTADSSMAKNVKHHEALTQARFDMFRRARQFAWDAIRPLVVQEADTTLPKDATNFRYFVDKETGKEMAYPNSVSFAMRFFPQDDFVMERSFIDVLVIAFDGHVHGLVTNDYGGLKKWIQEDSRGRIRCDPSSLIENLPNCSRRMEKKKLAITMTFDVAKLQYVAPPWWVVIPQVPFVLAEENIVTRADYHAKFGDDEDRRAFELACMERWQFMEEHLKEWEEDWLEELDRQRRQKDAQRRRKEPLIPKDLAREMHTEATLK